jgi:predicted membrane metal-binding protein
MVGADSSVIRAWIMASLMIIALYFGKSILVWRLVAIALILMLLYNPYFLPYDLGFLLSF